MKEAECIPNSFFEDHYSDTKTKKSKRNLKMSIQCEHRCKNIKPNISVYGNNKCEQMMFIHGMQGLFSIKSTSM